MDLPKRFLLLFFLALTQGDAQYLEVRRSATIREHPSSDSAVVEMAASGDHLALLDNGQQRNGYYAVKGKTTSLPGYIYRTLVRRHEGTPPAGSPSSTPASPSSPTLSFAPVPLGYYQAAEDLEGDELKTVLHHRIKDHVEFSYDEVWNILKETDVDPGDPSRVIGIYSGFSMSADSTVQGWNREHVWAKSRGDFGTTLGAGTDLHHLRAEDVSTNSARNNRSFDECDARYEDKSGVYKGMTACFNSSTSYTWEPRDEVKGDVARMIFYMAVRYEGEDGEPDLELSETNPPSSGKEPQHGKLSVLLRWHREDPVSDYERRRNHIIFTKYQHNRNPFIDHPEYVEKIW